MKKLKQYWWIAAGIVAILLIWIFIVPHPDAELRKRFNKERKELQNENKRKDNRIKSLQADSIQIRTEMAKRSKAYEEFARQSDEEYRKLKSSKPINLHNAGSHKLDSIRAVLFPK